MAAGLTAVAGCNPNNAAEVYKPSSLASARNGAPAAPKVEGVVAPAASPSVAVRPLPAVEQAPAAVKAAPAPTPAPGVPAPLAAISPDAKPAPRNSSFTMDAMVGDVNGRPIYAGAIFKNIGEDVFVRLGQDKNRLEFREQVKELILADLNARITNALILAEAERGLSEQEQMGLLALLQTEREKILAQFGGGVQAIAEEKLRKERGYGLEDEIESRRQRMLTQKYLQEKLYPKINITRREIERYYTDHQAEFNPAPTVTVRLIIVREAGDADQVDKALKNSETFESVARQHSSFRAETGGLMEPFELKGPIGEFNSLSFKELNEKVRLLKAGEFSDRTPIAAGFGWVKLEKVVGGDARTLADAQIEIEARLRTLKFNQLSRKYIADLLKNGNYTPIDQMTQGLIDVAMTRYARAQ